jgi:hypothetical protein
LLPQARAQRGGARSTNFVRRGHYLKVHTQSTHEAALSVLEEVDFMPRVTLGILCDLVYGALSAASMIPLQFPDKRAELLGALINRFSIGFVIGAVTLPWPGWAVGLVIGLLLSLADAIITKAYAPILILGAVGGAVIGIIAQKFGR